MHFLPISLSLSVVCLFVFVSHVSAGPKEKFIGCMRTNVSNYFSESGMTKVSDEMGKRICQGQTIKEIIADLLNVLRPGVTVMQYGPLLNTYNTASKCFKTCKTKKGGPSSMDTFLGMTGNIFTVCLKKFTTVLRGVAKKQGPEKCTNDRTLMYKAAAKNWKPNLFCQCARTIFAQSSGAEWKCVMDHVSTLLLLKNYNVNDPKCQK